MMAEYGIHKIMGFIVKFPVEVTGLSDTEWVLLDHYPTEDEYFKLVFVPPVEITKDLDHKIQELISKNFWELT